MKQLPSLPDYDHCLVNLASSVLKHFGAEYTAPTLSLADTYLAKDHKNVVVLLLDAMGVSILQKHLSENGFFRSHLAGSYSSVFPPTTVAATTSVPGGLFPCESAWLGWDCYYPQLGKNVTVCLDGLSDILPSGDDVSERIEAAELASLINGFLRACGEDERDIFILRYYGFMPVSDIAKKYGFTQSKVKMTLSRARRQLKEHLEQEEWI